MVEQMSTGTLLELISMADSANDVRTIRKTRAYDDESDIHTMADRHEVGEVTDADELIAEDDGHHTTGTPAAEWRKEIIGAGKVRWTKEELEAAVSSA